MANTCTNHSLTRDSFIFTGLFVATGETNKLPFLSTRIYFLNSSLHPSHKIQSLKTIKEYSGKQKQKTI